MVLLSSSTTTSVREGFPMSLLLWGSPSTWHHRGGSLIGASSCMLCIQVPYGIPVRPAILGGFTPPRPATIGFPAFLPYVPTSRPVQGV